MREHAVRRPSRPGALRIIGGRWRGRRIELPAGTAVRPTPDRVRETLFNWLAPYIEGARCLDLFAGSGALGIEALSRGAAAVVFVESEPRLAKAIEASLASLLGPEPQSVASVRAVDVDRFLGAASGHYDVAFADPPYERPIATVLERLLGVLSRHGRIYAERPVTEGLPEIEGLVWLKTGRAGRVCYGLAGVDIA